MAYIPLEKLLRNSGSLFKLVMASAKRATELSQGMPPLIQTRSKKVSTIALEEVADGKVWYEVYLKEGKESAKESAEEKASGKEA